MKKPTQAEVNQASMERVATKHELDAAVQQFEAAVIRGDAARLNLATTSAHAALQAHLDAIASGLTLARLQLGI